MSTTEIKMFEIEDSYIKTYDNSWRFLMKHLTAKEFFIVSSLSSKILIYTNSLQPLNDNVSITKLSKTFGMSKNVLKEILAKLLRLGVYSKFNIKTEDILYTNYWVFNPYLASYGSYTKTDVINLFKDSHFHKACNDENYKLTDKQIIELGINPKTVEKNKNFFN